MRLQLSALIDPVVRRLRFLTWRRGLRLAWQGVVVVGLSLLCLLVLAWLTLQWAILPHIEDWRPAIERHASAAVGTPVHIGHIAVPASRWVPALELRDVVLDDKSGAEALRLPHLTAALSARSLLAFAPRLSQLYVEGANLLVRRDAAGHLHVGGFDLAALPSGPARANADGDAMLDWLFSQDEIVLRGGAVRWVDEQRHAPMLQLGAVDIVLRNGLRSHDLRVDATPPADWGDRLELMVQARQPLFAHAGDWRRWTGTAYAALPRADVAQLKRHVDLPFELDAGTGAARVWLDFDASQWRELTADVQLRDVDLRLAHDVDPLAIAQAGGRFVAQRDANGVTLAARHFGFETAAGVAWPAGDLSLAWQQRQGSVARRHAGADPTPDAASAASAPVAPVLLWDADAPVTGGRLSADHLDLALMRRLASALPLPAPARQWLDEHQPDGMMSGLVARWTGPADAPTAYRASATIAGFGMAAGAVPAGARDGRPGWRGATLDFDASESGGVGHVTLDGGALVLPGVFEDPEIPFERFGANVAWTIGRPASAQRPAPIGVTLRDVHFTNADAEGELRAEWHTGTGIASAAAPASDASAAFGRGRRFPGTLDLQARLTHARAARLWRYLPQSVPEATRDYLHTAFASGDLDDVDFTVRGDLAAFPYARLHDGQFRIAGRVRGVDLEYVQGARNDDGTRAASAWPAFSDVAGQVVFDRNTLQIHGASGRAGALRLRDVEGDIAPGADQRPLLKIKGDVAGPVADFLRYVDRSPVGGWLHGGLARATATGDGALSLDLAIPLAHSVDTTVAGAFVLADSDVRLVPSAPLLANARARFDFTEHGMTASGGAARVLGGDATFSGGTQPDGGLRFVAQGGIDAEGLRRAVDDSASRRVAAVVGGQTTYQLHIGIAKGQTEFTLTSPLTGLSLALPAPLDKPAAATWPLRVSTSVSLDAPEAPRDTLRVDLAPPQGPAVRAEVVRDLSGAVPRPLRAAYAVGAPLPAPLAGGILMLKHPAIDGDAWLAFVRGLSAPPVAPTPVGATPLPPVDDAARASAGYVPRAAELATPDLLLGGRHLTHVDLQVAQVLAAGEEIWRANVVSDQTKGLLEYRPDTPARGAQLFARLDRLALGGHDEPPTVAAPATPAAPSAPERETSIPALDIVVDDFELDGKSLGKLEAAATLQPGGRDWRLTKLAMTTPEARFTGTGRWSNAPTRRMSLDFHLALEDSGAFLDRLGLGHVLKGGKGMLAGSVAWNGSPVALDYPSLQGQLKLALDAGQFLKADAGAGRLLSVLSLQSLPRRFTLDFRDLFQAGFAFDNVTGDVQIERGVATTKDLRMRGLSAAVLMAGRTDLKAETQDLDVIIVPEVNAGAASLAYAAINPVIGIGTFLAQLFLRSPLSEAGTRELHITGTWKAPKVDQVEHKAAVAAAAEAASQARAAEAASAAASTAAP